MNKPVAKKVDLYQWYDIARYIDSKYEVDSDDFRVFLMEQHNISNGGTIWVDFADYADYCDDSEFISHHHKISEFYADEFGGAYICFSW